PDAPDSQVLRVSQISVFIAAAITLLMAVNPPDMLVWLIWAGIGIMFSTFAVPLLAGLYWRGATREGAIASMALGLVSALFFGGLSYFKIKIFAMPMHFSFYAFVISVLAMIIVSTMTQKTPDKVLDETMTGWYIRK
ncbi:MAG: sodium:solute symporter family protein, partial [Methanoregulaceae archaeon]